MNNERNYYWLVSNPEIWTMKNLEVGEEESHSYFNEEGSKHNYYRNFKSCKVGDILISYSTAPERSVLGVLEIVGNDLEDKIYFRKIEEFKNPIPLEDFQENKKLENMEGFKIGLRGTLFKVEKEEFLIIANIIKEKNKNFNISKFL